MYDLKQSHHYSILKNLYGSRSLTADQKQQLYDKVIEGNESDQKGLVIKACESRKDDAASKAAVWKQITDKNSTLSFYEKRELCDGFYSWGQLDICEEYFDKFYDVIGGFDKDHTYKYFQAFFLNLLPRMTIDDKHIVKLVLLKNDVADNNKTTMNMLQDGIELLLRTKTIREYAQKQAQIQ